jgi:plastocyanin
MRPLVRVLSRGILVLFLGNVLVWAFEARPLRAQASEGAHYAQLDDVGADKSAMKNMSSADMARWVHDFYKTHPTVGRPAPQGSPVATFTATGTTYDADGNLGTQIDTVRILTGQTVLWHAANGSHTVTSGTGASDPTAGVLFDASINSLSAPNFSFTFNTAGVYNFFCRPHEFFNMKGVVIVTDPVITATFTIQPSAFDTDHNAATQVDTAYIRPGESVFWILVQGLDEGIHTVTNGTGAADPAAGTIFDIGIDPADSTFVHQYDQEGTFPFFCRVHENLNMRGVVFVSNLVGVPPVAPSRRIGFASEPEPNPTSGQVSFRLAVPTAGPASVRVYDTRG